METEDHKSRDELLLEKLRQIVMENLSNEQFGVDDLAKSYGISRSQLHRKLKKLTKKSISRFIREIRLDEAHKMLKQNTGTVSEIAYKVGFSSPTYFNTCYSEYFGYPPGEASLRANTVVDERMYDTPKRTNKNRLYLVLAGAILALVLLSVYLWPQDSEPVQNTSVDVTEIPEIPEKSIAILPLKNWTGDPDQEYISDGMTDAIISRLAEINDIEKVVPFTSTILYKQSDQSIPELADRLGVNYIMEGSFQRFGNNFRINLRLVNAVSDKLNWSESFEGAWQINDMFEIQSRIAESIAERLEAQILEEEYEFLRRKPTLNKDAYTYFLRAEYNMLLLNRSGIENSKSLYEKAISIDPKFVDAHIRLALAWMLSGWVWGIHNEQDAWSKTKEYIDRVNKMDGITEHERKEISELYESGSYFFEWNFAPAKRYFEAYLATDTPVAFFSNNNRVVSSISLANDYAKHNGRYEEALLILKDIASRDSGAQAGYGVNEILLRLFLGQEEAAIRELNSNDDLYDNNFYYLMESSQIYYYLGDYSSLDNNVSKLMERFSDRPPRILFLNAINHNLKDEFEKENEFVQTLFKRYKENAPGSPGWFTALYYAHLGNQKKCLEWLEKCFERHEVEMIWLRTEPLLDFIKCDPHYFDLYKKVGFLSDPPCQLKDNQQIELNP